MNNMTLDDHIQRLNTLMAALEHRLALIPEVASIERLLARYYNVVLTAEGHDYLDGGDFTPAEIARIVSIVQRHTTPDATSDKS